MDITRKDFIKKAGMLGLGVAALPFLPKMEEKIKLPSFKKVNSPDRLLGVATEDARRGDMMSLVTHGNVEIRVIGLEV